MKMLYYVNHIDVTTEFSKITGISRIEEDGATDYKLVFDDRSSFVLLSDVAYVVDDSNVKHTDNLLEFLLQQLTM